MTSAFSQSAASESVIECLWIPRPDREAPVENSAGMSYPADKGRVPLATERRPHFLTQWAFRGCGR
jgi:hypothetical protein